MYPQSLPEIFPNLPKPFQNRLKMVPKSIQKASWRPSWASWGPSWTRSLKRRDFEDPKVAIEAPKWSPNPWNLRKKRAKNDYKKHSISRHCFSSIFHDFGAIFGSISRTLGSLKMSIWSRRNAHFPILGVPKSTSKNDPPRSSEKVGLWSILGYPNAPENIENNEKTLKKTNPEKRRKKPQKWSKKDPKREHTRNTDALRVPLSSLLRF
jgi:hypothetical protein